MDFKQYLQEAADKTAVMAFGRFNPPTVGHEKLIQKVKNEADERGASGHIFASHAQNTDKDPLPQKAKLGFLNRIAYGNTIHGSSKEQPTFLHAAAKLYSQGHKHLVMIAGSDRVQEYKEKLEKYNDGKEYPHGKYKFKSIQVVSAGSRDPDAEGVEGMSGTKMREFARKNSMGKFRSGLPEGLQDHAEEIAAHINKATGVTKAAAAKKENHNPWLKEDYDNPRRFDWGTPEGTAYMQSMTPNKKLECTNPGEVWSEKMGMCVSLREAYVNYDIFKLEDLVEAKNGDRGFIVYRGATYVTMQLESGKTVKHWIQDIKETIRERVITTPFTQEIIRERQAGERQVPALFLPKVNEENSSMELTYDGYTTKYLHMCPGASKQLKELIGKKDLNPKYILQAIMATDQYLQIEKEALAKGFANDKVAHDFLMKFAIAHDTLNMLGYPDKDLMYMEKHIVTMSKLNMHKDASFANELMSTVTTQGVSGVEEGYDSSDYRVVITPTGRKIKVHPKRVLTDKQDQQTESKVMADYKKVMKAVSELYEPDPPTANRDINRTGDKEVFHGIDAVHPEAGHPGKPVGLVSFKSYLATPETAKIEAQKTDAMQDVHRQKAELQQHSTAYKMMKKHQQLEP